MQFTNTLFAFPLLYTLASAAPVSPDSQDALVAAIIGLPADSYPDHLYVANGTYFFGNPAIIPTKSKQSAITWKIGSDADLISLNDYTIALNPPYALPQAQSISFVPYNGTQGTFVVGGKDVMNRSPTFGSWQFCNSQYGAFLDYVTPGYVSQNACYHVEFVLEKK